MEHSELLPSNESNRPIGLSFHFCTYFSDKPTNVTPDTVTCGMAYPSISPESKVGDYDSDVKSRFRASLTLTVHAILLQSVAIEAGACTVAHAQLRARRA